MPSGFVDFEVSGLVKKSAISNFSFIDLSWSSSRIFVSAVIWINVEMEAKITSNDDIVDKQVDRLKDVKGDLFGKQQQLVAQLVINKWKKKNAMAGVVFQAVRGII
jgi:bifunctional DNase/RNase